MSELLSVYTAMTADFRIALCNGMVYNVTMMKNRNLIKKIKWILS